MSRIRRAATCVSGAGAAPPEQPALARAAARRRPRRAAPATRPTASLAPMVSGPVQPVRRARTSPARARARSTSSSSPGRPARTSPPRCATRASSRPAAAYLEAAAGDPKRAAAIQPGTYALLKGMRAQDAFDTLTDPANRDVNRTTIREGLWKAETFAALSKSTGVPVKEYVKAAKDTKAIGLPKEADGDVEGWLFPSTYEFADKATAEQQLKAMVGADGQGARGGRRPREGLAAHADHRLDRRGRGQRRRRPRQGRAGHPQPPRRRSARTTGCSRWTPRCTSSPRSAARPARPTRSAPRTAPTTPTASRDCRPARSATRAPPRSRRRPTRPTGDWHFFVTVDPSTGETKFAHDPGRARPQRPGVPGLVQRQPGQVLRAAVLGSPVAHSLSPVLHRAGYAAAGLEGWDYDAHEVDAAGLAAFVGGLDGRVARPVADDAAQGGRARRREHRVGRRDPGRRRQHPRAPRRRRAGTRRTPTSRRSCAALRPHLAGDPTRALVLGAGATARSAVLALAELGVTTLTVRARDTASAADLLAWALGHGIRSGSVAGIGPWLTTRDDVVVSTVPAAAGRPSPPPCPPRTPACCSTSCTPGGRRRSARAAGRRG